MRIFFVLAIPAITRGSTTGQFEWIKEPGSNGVTDWNKDPRSVASRLIVDYKSVDGGYAVRRAVLNCKSVNLEWNYKITASDKLEKLRGAYTADTGSDTLESMKNELIKKIYDECNQRFKGLNSREYFDVEVVGVETFIHDLYQIPQKKGYTCVCKKSRNQQTQGVIDENTKYYVNLPSKIDAAEVANKLNVPLGQRFLYNRDKASELCVEALKEELGRSNGHVALHNP